jgi:predicted acetylornithine/succinylornithine family transaminase
MFLFDNYQRHNINFVKGAGSYLYSDSGKKYLDCSSGISVTNLGHAHPHIVLKLKEQADKLWHVSNLFISESGEALAERISRLSFGGKVFFCNSGAEANEAAIKLARIYNNKVLGGKRPKIITMTNSFHGRTYATLSATGQEKVHNGFEPIADFFTHIPLNNPAAFEEEIAKGDACAVMIEIIQGEAGVIPAEHDYVKALVRLARQNGILVIYDEVQTAFGRAGKMFAYEWLDTPPDIMTLAKSIANGIPMGAVVAEENAAALFTYGTHASTFGGNLLAVAAAHAVLDILQEEGFLEEVCKKGQYFRKYLQNAISEFPKSDETIIRGEGLMTGIVFPFPNTDFVNYALNEELLTLQGGNNSVRLYPPLTATINELEEAAEKAKVAYRRALL